MDIFKWFKNDGTKELQEKVAALVTVISNGSINKSLMGINGSGNVQWYNTGGDNSYDSHYTIYRGIDMLASLGAGLSVNLYKGDQMMDGNFRLPMGFDIQKPHPNMSLNQVLYTALIYFFYRGEFMVEISDDPMFHLIPINPKYMTRVRNSMNWKFALNGKSRIIEEENLIYIQLINPDKPDNLGRGLSPVDVVKADLLNEKSAINYNTSFFKNFGQVGGFFFDSTGKARKDDMNTIVDQYDYLQKGSDKAYKTLGLPGGIRYEDFGQTMREMQYLESRKDIRDRILAVLGIHKALFGVTDQVNRSVSEEATRMLWIHNLKPKMIMIQDKINQVLFRRYFPGYKFRYNFSEIAELREAAESVMKQVILYQALGYTTNEINDRFDLGMEEMKDARGSMRLVPSNFIPSDELIVDNSPIKETKSIDMSVLDDLLSIEDKALKVNASTFIRKHNKIFRASTKLMTGKLGKFFSTELGQVIKTILQFDNLDVNTILSEIQNLISKNKSILQDTMNPLYKLASLEADTLALESIGIVAEPLVNEIVVAGMTNQISMISNHTYRLVRTQIKSGVEAGDSIDMIAKRVQNVYKMNSSRARTIARTESGGVIHKTTDLRYKDAGVTKKQWLNTKDGNSRSTHSGNAGMGVVDYNYTYSNGQKFPNDGNGSAGDNINCRCTYIGVI